MPSDTIADLETQIDLLRLALGNAARSVPLQLCAMAFVVYVGLDVGAVAAAWSAGAIGAATGVSRWLGARRLLARPQLDQASLHSGTLLLELNALAAGLAWAVATFGIYPHLSGTTAVTYVAIICGSIAVAAFFMALLGRAFFILVLLQLGALIVVSLFGGSSGSVPLAVLATIFGLTSYRAARELREVTARSIRHGREVDRANAALTDALQAAEAAGLAKSQFLATMSHEIRTPMNGVLGALELLRCTALDAQQKRLVRTAASSGESLMAILNDVLDHAKVEAGRLELRAAPMSLRGVAGSVVALFRSNAEAKGLRLLLDIAPGSADAVIGDSQRLKQVLLNLVGNAIKFTERGQVSLTLAPAPAPAGKVGLRFSVLDTGIGIGPDELQAVFEPFRQAQDRSARQQQLRVGTGLGLAISQRIVGAMGGRIELHSQLGQGSRFSFELALEPDLAAPAASEAADSMLDDPQLQDLPPATVLVVEDNEVNRLIAREMLRALGMQVLEATEGAAALELLAREPVDLVLMDLQMPVLDGYAAARQIRQRECERGTARRVPIVAVTANAFEDDAAQVLRAGMDAHLAKPYSPLQLHALLKQWL